MAGTQKKGPGSIVVYNNDHNPKLRLRLQVDGKIFVKHGLADTPENWKIGQKILDDEYLKMKGFKKPDKPVVLISDAWDNYRRNYLVNKAHKTILGYIDSYKKIVAADMILSKDNITLLIDNFISQSKGNLSNTSINIYVRQFRAFIFWCVDKDLMDRMSFKSFRLTETRKEIKIYTEHEIKLLLDYYSKEDSEFKRLIEFMINTGARINETLELTWQDIRDNEIIFSNKTNKKFETVPISNKVRKILEEQKNDSNKVWRWMGSSASFLNGYMQRGFAAVGIRKQGRAFHEFRKTFLYRLFQAGTPVEIAYKLMRHHNIQVTMNYYAYFDKSTLQSYMDNLERNFG